MSEGLANSERNHPLKLMNTKLKSLIEEAINKVIQDNTEKEYWDGWIHDELVAQMATAAEQVFDSSMKAQEFAERENL